MQCINRVRFFSGQQLKLNYSQARGLRVREGCTENENEVGCTAHASKVRKTGVHEKMLSARAAHPLLKKGGQVGMYVSKVTFGIKPCAMVCFAARCLRERDERDNSWCKVLYREYEEEN